MDMATAQGGAGDSNARELIRVGDGLFSKKSQLHSLWQTIAEEVYQARADFTRERSDGTEFMDEQFESVPAQNRRDLSSALGALSRPKSQMWFEYKARDEKRNTDPAKAWFSQARDKQRTLLYTYRAGFQRAMKMGDNDFVTFGNAVHSMVEDDNRGRTVCYGTHHLRDCAWFEDKNRLVIGMFRKFKVSFANWERVFGRGYKVPAVYETLARENPHQEITCWHISVPVGYYDFYGKRPRNPQHKYASIYLDPQQQVIIKESANYEFPYLVRRWELIEGSQYAHSPAAMYGLIDARLLQAESRVILEAGERIIDPPLIARAQGVLGQINNYPGATNWIDSQYDERNGPALAALRTEANIPLSLEMKQDTRQILAAAWYLNKLNLPNEKDMTAFEVNERISEYIRSIGPVIEPFQDDNSTLLDASFTMNMRLGNFGPPQMIPPEILGQDIVFEFDGPMQQAYKRIKLGNAREVVQFATSLIAMNPQSPPEALDNINLDQITRDAMGYMSSEPGWVTPEESVAATRQGRQQAQAQQQQTMQAAQAIQGIGAAAELGPKLAAANQSMPLITDGSGQGAASDPYPQEEQAAA